MAPCLTYSRAAPQRYPAVDPHLRLVNKVLVDGLLPQVAPVDLAAHPVPLALAELELQQQKKLLLHAGHITEAVQNSDS